MIRHISSLAVSLARIDRHPKVGCIAAVGSHLADHDRRMRRGQGIRLNDYCGTKLAVVARCCNRHRRASSGIKFRNCFDPPESVQFTRSKQASHLLRDAPTDNFRWRV